MHLISEVGKGTTFWFDLKVYEETPLQLPETDIPKPTEISTEALPPPGSLGDPETKPISAIVS
ncbi:hypothetical protein [Kovacikia minuta]